MQLFLIYRVESGFNGYGGVVMDGIIYLVGLIVIVMAILSLLGLR